MIGLRRTTLFCFGLLLATFLLGAPIHWVPVGPPGNPSITAMAVAQPNGPSALPSILFAGTTGGGAWRSDDAGLTWATLSGLDGRDVTALAIHQYELPLGAPIIAFVTTLYAGTAGGGVLRRDPGSMSWTAVNNGLTSLSINALLALPGGAPTSATLLVGTADGLFESTDSGTTWSPRKTGLPSGSERAVLSLAVEPGSLATAYAGTTGGLFKSNDAGDSWTKLDLESTFKIAVSTIAVDPLAPSRIYTAGIASPLCAPLCLAPSFATSLRSLDGGASWSTMTGLAGNFVRAFAATPNLPSRVFAGTAGNGVHESADGGLTWTAANDGLGLASVSSLAIDPVLPSLIFAGTSQGVFCAPLGQVAVTCFSGGQALCLNAHRFGASVVWRDPNHNTGTGQALAITDNTGAFWFFDPTNLELVVKVLDGRSVNGKYWVFYGSLTNVEFTLAVIDTLTGAVKTYFNPQAQQASVADTAAF